MNRPEIIKNKNHFQLLDDNRGTLKTRTAQRELQILEPLFSDKDNLILKSNLNYIQIENLVDKLNHKLGRKSLPLIKKNEEVEYFIKNQKYQIKEHSDAGRQLKSYDPRWHDKYVNFKHIVDSEICRPLKPQQERASFYLVEMKRAANFSVPGSGKTAMMYGTFAFLSSKSQKKVNKIFVVCPLNAFAAWKSEFSEVFGNKRKLNILNLRDKKYKEKHYLIARDWLKANVVIVNYESLGNNLDTINDLIDKRTMLVFDEVHRIKKVGGNRAAAALKLNKAAYYRYVLTGTPIPNSYQDVYNFLNLMYPNEYSYYFHWGPNDLNSVASDEVNNKLAPFFWRTNKKDLHVPEPDPDNLIKVNPSEGQQKLVKAIYKNETNPLAKFTRLLQASTNPQLLRFNINYQDLGLVDIDNFKFKFQKFYSDPKEYKKFSLDTIQSPKFNTGIKLIERLVDEGKKVLVWGIFVDTMKKIVDTLNAKNINTLLIYGGTPKEKRDSLIDKFKNGDVQVLVSNPNTLGESISLHKTVHDAVYFEYNFNLTFMLQSRDRINRLGLPEGQYTRYYYLMTNGDTAHGGFIDNTVYKKLKDKEEIMLKAIDGNMLVPEYTDSYLNEVKEIVNGVYKL